MKLDGRVVQEFVLIRIAALNAHMLDAVRKGQIVRRTRHSGMQRDQ
jgi:hypothetical protein